MLGETCEEHVGCEIPDVDEDTGNCVAEELTRFGTYLTTQDKLVDEVVDDVLAKRNIRKKITNGRAADSNPSPLDNRPTALPLDQTTAAKVNKKDLPHLKRSTLVYSTGNCDNYFSHLP